ncbi:lipopolysaccharide-induced tumor necrosis factor-alpha factor homolog [Brachyhypopomus gauderio]|uniref:lipopolysaccharide-induced tumor necrosis factor-alpha factor homolog n=1 Tax=Brachyhypopomus gauderio TaxID=698409 RepID=UPI00404303ED
MDVREDTVYTIQPPSYSEACQCPSYVGQTAHPSTPPPTYSEAVGAVVPTPNVTTATPYPLLHLPTEVRTHQQVPPGSVQHTVRAERPRVALSPLQASRVPLGDGPTVTICTHCHQLITTTVDYKPGAAAWGMCCLLTLLGLICGICLIPFCIRSLQDAHHTCPQCNRHIGIYVRK